LEIRAWFRAVDCGFDYSVLSNFRARLVENDQQTLLLNRIIELLRDKKLLKERQTTH